MAEMFIKTVVGTILFMLLGVGFITAVILVVEKIKEWRS